MFYKKPGYPKEDEIVICTVKRILPNAVFASLDEYQHIEGLIHISEISPGRVRNIRDFVRENKRIVCKVLRVNREKNQLDLSLRRVSLALRTKKITEIRQEERSEKILEDAGKELNLSLEEMYKKAGNKLIQHYGLLFTAFLDIIKDPSLIKELIDPKIASILINIVKEKIKPQEVKISAILKISSKAPNGLEIIKAALNKLTLLSQKDNIDSDILYLGAPRYKLTIKATDYKTAEKQLTSLADSASSNIKQNHGEFELIR